MLSQYTAGRTAMLNGPKPTFFHNAQDVELFYPNLANTASGPPVRRTKAGGANVLRSAAINDTLSQLSAQNREHAQTQQLAAWHSQHEVKNKQGERTRNEKQSVRARTHTHARHTQAQRQRAGCQTASLTPSRVSPSDRVDALCAPSSSHFVCCLRLSLAPCPRLCFAPGRVFV